MLNGTSTFVAWCRVLNHNHLNGTLNISSNASNLLLSVNLQSNFLTAFKDKPEANKDVTITYVLILSLHWINSFLMFPMPK